MSFKPGAKLNLTSSLTSGVGSLNHLSGPLFKSRSRDPHKIDFTGEWGEGPTEDWYRGLKKDGVSTTFKSLEYRKERDYPFYHEFIVVDLGNNTVCRFDRRGDLNSRANFLVGDPIPSEDTAHVIDKFDKNKLYDKMKDESDLLLTMHFPKGQDIKTILAICYGIQMHINSQFYTLLRYNCYFFSWMIVTATARCTVDWALLAREESMWKNLVATVIKGLDGDDPGPGPTVAIPPTPTAKSKDDSRAPHRFVGSAYLVITLQKALEETKKQIGDSLAELILESTVDQAMRDVSQASAQKAADQAARNHAAHAARDAAMEAVIESMWREIIGSSEGGNLWERKCKLAEDCVREASAAAADTAEQSRRISIAPATTPASESGAPLPTPTTDRAEPVPAPPSKWESAWDATWAEKWASGNESGRSRSNTTGSRNEDPSSSISDRAKRAWIKAWEDARQANERYVPLISNGVAQYVTTNLSEVLPNAFTYETNASTLKTVVKALVSTSNSSNSKLQEWIKARIQDHCGRVLRATVAAQQPRQEEFEDTMKVIWGSILHCLPNPSEGEPADSEAPTQ